MEAQFIRGQPDQPPGEPHRGLYRATLDMRADVHRDGADPAGQGSSPGRPEPLG